MLCFYYLLFVIKHRNTEGIIVSVFKIIINTYILCFWQGSSKARAQRDNSVGSDSGSSICTVNSSQDQPCPDDPLPAFTQLRPTSPLR